MAMADAVVSATEPRLEIAEDMVDAGQPKGNPVVPHGTLPIRACGSQPDKHCTIESILFIERSLTNSMYVIVRKFVKEKKDTVEGDMAYREVGRINSAAVAGWRRPACHRAGDGGGSQDHRRVHPCGYGDWGPAGWASLWAGMGCFRVGF